MAALSVAVFSFWLFLRPYVILAREQSQLFLWNREYFLERITIPGGLAQYVGEFVVQFFINPIYGAIIYAIVCAAAFWLMQQLTKGAKHSTAFSLLFAGLIWWLTTNIYIPMTPVVATLTTLSVLCLLARLDRPFIPMLILTPLLYWLVGPAAIVLPLALIFPRFRRPKRRLSMVQSGVLLLLLVLCLVGSSWVAPYPLRQIARGIDYYWEDKHRSTPEEMKYDMLMRQRKWQSIAQQYQSERPQSPAIEGAAALSMFQLQQIGQTELANACRRRTNSCVASRRHSS